MSRPNETGEQPIRIRIPHPHEKITIPGSKPLASSVDIFTKDVSIRRATDIPFPDSWDEIKGIHETRGQTVEKSEDLVFVVELPLYKAVRMLFDAGIRTTESNAHFGPNQEETIIGLGIDWSTLSPNQRNAAEKLCKDEPDKWEHIPADKHPDHYEALYLSWKIKKGEVSPRQVKAYVEQKVAELIQGRVIIRLRP